MERLSAAGSTDSTYVTKPIVSQSDTTDVSKIIIPVGQKEEKEDDMTGLQVEIKPSANDNTNTGSVAEKIATDPSGVTEDAYHKLIELSQGKFSSETINDATVTLEKIAGNDDETIDFMTEDEIEDGIHLRGEGYSEYNKDSGDDKNSYASVNGANAVFTYGNSEQKISAYAGFSYKNTVEVNQNKAPENDYEILLIENEEGELDLNSVTSDYLNDDGQNSKTYGAFGMIKKTLDNGNIVSAGASTNQINNTTRVDAVSVGYADVTKRHFAASLTRKFYTVETPDGKEKSAKNNFKVSLLPVKPAAETNSAEETNESEEMTGEETYNVRGYLQTDIDLGNDEYNDQQGIIFNYTFPLIQNEKTQFTVTPLAGIYNVDPDDVDEDNLCKLTTSIKADFNTVTPHNWNISADFQATNEHKTDFDSDCSNVFYTSLNANIQKNLKNGNNLKISADGCYISAGDIKIPYVLLGITLTSRNIAVEAGITSSCLKIENQHNAKTTDLSYGGRIIVTLP